MSIEYLQSVDDTPVYGVGSTHVHLRKPHGEVAQPAAVTEWVRALPAVSKPHGGPELLSYHLSGCILLAGITFCPRGG